MNCKNCGSPLVPEDKFCKLCGTKVEKNEVGVIPSNPVNMDKPVPGPNPVSQPASPTPIKVNNPSVAPIPTPIKANGPVGLKEPSLERTQTLGNTQNMGPAINRTQNMGPRPMPGFQRPVPPAPRQDMPVNTVPPVEPEKKSVLTPIVIVLVVIGLIVGGYFGYKAFANKDEDDNDTNPVAVNSAKVDFKGFTFDVPSKFIVEKDNDLLTLDDGTFGFVLSIIDYSYNQLNTTQVISNFQKEGMTAEYKGEKEVKGTKYQLFNVKRGGETIYIAYCSLGASKLLGLTIYNNPTTVLPTQANLEEAIIVGSSGQYTGAHNIETNGLEKLDPKSVLVEEANAADVLDYVEDYSYADVTVEELY